MLNNSFFSRKLRGYIKDYRRECYYCENCHKVIYRVFFVLDGKPLKRAIIAGMNQKIDEKSWLEIKGKLQVLCRFCCNTYERNNSKLFDYVSFNKYLFLCTELGSSSIIEYMNRLRRIENILISSKISLHNLSIREIECELNKVIDFNLMRSLSVVLKKYNEFLILNE